MVGMMKQATITARTGNHLVDAIGNDQQVFAQAFQNQPTDGAGIAPAVLS